MFVPFIQVDIEMCLQSPHVENNAKYNARTV